MQRVRRLERMEAGSVDVYKEERENRYDIYVEEYVLSYLKREADSLELSEIYFFGKRENDGRKIYVYGAGREEKLAVFAAYEPLTELVCRLTQAGPVFMVRGADGSCKATGFQVFYETNEAMQSFLIEWTSNEDKSRKEEENAVQETALFPVMAGETKKHTAHGAISAQLCLILVVLVAIVISSTDSYDKMEQLGQSAREVFFAIENQESGEVAENSGEQTEIVVERDMAAEAYGKEDSASPGNTDQRKAGLSDTGAFGKEEEPEEGVLEPVENREKEEDGQSSKEDASGKAEETGKAAEAAGQSSAEEAAGKDEETAKKGDTSVDSETEEAEETQSDEENTEAFSRSITRYYEVKQGDTLYTISREIYGDISRVGKICEVNQISDPDQIRSGQKIILP